MYSSNKIAGNVMEWLAIITLIMLCMVFGVRAVLAGLAFAALVGGAGLALLVGRLI